MVEEQPDQKILQLLHLYRRVNHATQVEHAIRGHNVKFLHYLLKKENVLEQRHMSMAVKARAFRVIKYLFRRGFKIDLPGEFYLATSAGASIGLQVVRTLVELGANVNTKDDRGCSPLSRCLRGVVPVNIFTMMNLLLDNGADVNSVDNVGHTPVIHCVKTRHHPDLVEVLKTLFRRGADERVKDSDGLSIERILFQRHRFGYCRSYPEVVLILNRVHIWRNKKCFSQVCTTFYCASKSRATETPTENTENPIKKPRTSSNVSFLEAEVDILHIIFSFLRAD